MLCRTQINILSLIYTESWILDQNFNQISWHGYQTANRKDHSFSAIFLIYSIFNNRNQVSLFPRKAYDKLITMTGKKVGWSCSLVSYSHFSTDRAHVFNVHVHNCMLNYAINYAQKRCAMQMWGITDKWIGDLDKV